VAEGTLLHPAVKGNGNCHGKKVKFTVWEDDGLFGISLLRDPVKVNPQTVDYDPIANQAVGYWVSEFQPDGIFDLGGSPEYYFEASLEDSTTQSGANAGMTIRSSGPEIVVSPGTGLVIKSYPKVEVASSSATISWITNKIGTSELSLGLPGLTYSQTVMGNEINEIHTATINNLRPCVAYTFQLKSAEGAEEAVLPNLPLRTAGCFANTSVESEVYSTIEATSGGRLNLSNGQSGIALQVPPNFATTSARPRANFQIRRLLRGALFTLPVTPQGYDLVSSNVYNLAALTGVTEALTYFDQPLTVTMNYGGEDISRVREETLTVFRWDGISWEGLYNCQVNTAEKTVTCQTSRFSDFALLSPF